MVDQIIAGVEPRATGGARVLLVSAEGRGFSRGPRHRRRQPGEEDGGQVLAEIFNPMVQAVADLPFPTIAAVQGACLGTGLGLALACDVVIAADNAKFGSPFAKIGAVLDSGAHLAFVTGSAPPCTMDLIYSGRFLSGAEAAAAGLVVAGGARRRAADDGPRDGPLGGPRPGHGVRRVEGLVRRIGDAPVTLSEVLELEAGAQSRSSQTKDYSRGSPPSSNAASPPSPGSDRMPLLDRPGARIHWESTGQGSPLLLVQGLGYPSEANRRIVPGLAEHHTVIELDNRGVGRSDVPPDVPGSPDDIVTISRWPLMPQPSSRRWASGRARRRVVDGGPHRPGARPNPARPRAHPHPGLHVARVARRQSHSRQRSPPTSPSSPRCRRERPPSGRPSRLLRCHARAAGVRGHRRCG